MFYNNSSIILKNNILNKKSAKNHFFDNYSGYFLFFNHFFKNKEIFKSKIKKLS